MPWAKIKRVAPLPSKSEKSVFLGVKFWSCNTWSDVTSLVPSTPCPSCNSSPSGSSALRDHHAQPNYSHENFSPVQRQPSKTYWKVSASNSYRDAHYGQSVLGQGNDFYTAGLFLRLLHNPAVYNQTEKHGRTADGKMWTREIRAKCVPADMERSIHRTLTSRLRAAGPPHPVLL